MLLLITIKPDIYVNLHSEDTDATALAHQYLGPRVRACMEHAIANDRRQGVLAAALAGSIADEDRAALSAMGFTGVAVALLFEPAPSETTDVGS